MTKYKILVEYVCEADSEFGAIFALNKTLRPLVESELSKFEAVKVKVTK